MEDLLDYLRRRLSPEDLAELEQLGAEIEYPGEMDLKAVQRRVLPRVKKERGLIEFAQSRQAKHYKGLLDLPDDRRSLLLRNSSPVLLLVLFRDLVEQSFAERFGDLKRSLALAALALEVAKFTARSRYLSRQDSEDLLGEAHAYLGNARRINSDMRGAAESLIMAEDHFFFGTGDWTLKAKFHSFMASLRVSEGRCLDAVAFVDREIALRRLLGDDEELGFSLVQRAWIGCIIGEPFEQTCQLFKDGLSRVGDLLLLAQAANSLAGALAREGHGIDALIALTKGEMALYYIESEWLKLHHRWTRGITFRALGDLKQAEKDLLAVRDKIAESEGAYRAGIVGLDLAAVYAAQGRLDEVKRLAAESYALFKAEDLEAWALDALIVLRDAAEAERVTEGMAVAVANFLARFPYNKALRFEWEGEV